MARGGARVRSGPPPDPEALRRERDGRSWTNLPERREGDVPDWPLPRQTAAERAVWAELWTMPQAIMWERQRQFYEVALYTRTLLRASRSPVASLAAAAVRMADSLGLTTGGLLRNRWKIGTEESATQSTVPRRSRRSSTKDRLRVLQGGS